MDDRSGADPAATTKTYGALPNSSFVQGSHSVDKWITPTVTNDSAELIAGSRLGTLKIIGEY